jgi:hypothetical protein
LKFLVRYSIFKIAEIDGVRCQVSGINGCQVSVFRFQRFSVQGFKVQKKANRLGSYKAGKLEGSKAFRLSGLPASQLQAYDL